MTIRNHFDVEMLRKIGRIVAETRELMKNSIEAGMTTLELDRIAEENLARHGATSAPRKVYNFPGATCISINEEVAHGIPSDRKIADGDLINVDVSAELGGYFADTGCTILFGREDPELRRLCDCSRRALRKAIHSARAGEKFNRVGAAIENEARKNGYAVIRNLTGHGTGGTLHEYPDHLLNYFDPAQKGVFAKGMVVAIETFVSTGADFAEEAGDGWTLKTDDGSFVAQYEHTLIVTDKDPIILTEAV
jgi:methionyl aminopeptidase